MSLGLDPDDHAGAQRDFQFMRDLRLSAETVNRQGLITARAFWSPECIALIGYALFVSTRRDSSDRSCAFARGEWSAVMGALF